MSRLANITINSICVYSKHYYVSDMIQCRLVRSKLLTCLKPVNRRSMAQKAWGSFQGSFGQYNEIVKHIEKHKKGLPSLSGTKTLGQWQSMLWTINGIQQ